MAKYIKERHYTVYGNVNLTRKFCSRCKGMTIVLENKFQCCGRTTSGKISNKFEIMVPPRRFRKTLRIKKKREILQRQNNRCIYCNIPFGTPYIHNVKIHITIAHFDHIIPFSYSRLSAENQFVAACNICNSIKHDKFFDNFQAISEFLEKERGRKGYEFIENESD